MELLNSFDTIANDIAQIIVVFSIAFALLQCFAGYRLLKIMVAIVCFILGFAIGFGLALPNFSDAYAPSAIGIITGALLAFAGFKLYLVGVFIYCGSLATYALSFIPFPKENPWPVIAMVLSIAAFVAVGILGVKFSKACIIIITSISGAINAINLMATPIAELDKNVALRIILIILTAILGVVVQRLTNKKA